MISNTNLMSNLLHAYYAYLEFNIIVNYLTISNVICQIKKKKCFRNLNKHCFHENQNTKRLNL